jgi:AcrR family transcriptional regulator
MTQSKLEVSRQNGAHQVRAQRESILDAAETLFLRHGIAETTMVHVAAEAGITKVTLYRYFPNRDVIAMHVWERMLQRIMASFGPLAWPLTVAKIQAMASVMIRNFDTLRDAYRFIGIFDSFYLDTAGNSEMTRWLAEESILVKLSGAIAAPGIAMGPLEQRYLVVLNSVIWFLERMALRGGVTMADFDTSLETQLAIFEEMIVGYLQRLPESHEIGGLERQ